MTPEIAIVALLLARNKKVIGEYQSHHKRKGMGVVVRYEHGVYNIRIGDHERILCVQDLENTDHLWAFGFYDEEQKNLKTCDVTIAHFQHRWFSR